VICLSDSMETRKKQYIENECAKDWNQYLDFMRNDQNRKDVEKIIDFFFGDILPEAELKGQNTLFQRMSKDEKLQVIEHPQSFLYSYVQNLMHQEQNTNIYVLKEVVTSLKTLHKNVEEKKKECVENMKKLIQFFTVLLASQKILLSNPKLDFREKTVLTSQEHANELGEIFSRYLLSILFSQNGVAQNFYHGIFDKVEGQEMGEWHPLLKFWILHYYTIGHLFSKDREMTTIFSANSMKKHMKEVSKFMKGGDKKSSSNRKSKSSFSSSSSFGRPRTSTYPTRTPEKERRTFMRQRGGDPRTGKVSTSAIRAYEKIEKEREREKEKKYTEKQKELVNPDTEVVRNLFKSTLVSNVNPSGNKPDDKLVNLFESEEFAKKVQAYYERVFFEADGPCRQTSSNSEKGERKIGECNPEKKVPIIFAKHNPEAYFNIRDLYRSKSGPEDELRKKGRLTESGKKKLLEFCRARIRVYQSCYAFDEERFNTIFLPKLKEFQLHLIYLLYTLHQKKHQMYHYLSEAIQGVSLENFNFGDNEEEAEETGNTSLTNAKKRAVIPVGAFPNNVLSNQGKTLQKLLQKNYRDLHPSTVTKLEIIQKDLEAVVVQRKKVSLEEYGTPGYNQKISKYDDFLKQVYLAVKKILEENREKPRPPPSRVPNQNRNRNRSQNQNRPLNEGVEGEEEEEVD
jgi:hypothetical protein